MRDKRRGQTPIEDQVFLRQEFHRVIHETRGLSKTNGTHRCTANSLVHGNSTDTSRKNVFPLPTNVVERMFWSLDFARWVAQLRENRVFQRNGASWLSNLQRSKSSPLARRFSHRFFLIPSATKFSHRSPRRVPDRQSYLSDFWLQRITSSGEVKYSLRTLNSFNISVY